MMANKKFLISIGCFLLLALVFSSAFAENPLYTQNQNSKFLIGLADGGLGFLKEDWLANTTNPFPVFSFLVSVTYRYLNENLFYFYYVLILGIYLYSILGIVSKVYDINKPRAKYLTYLALIIMLHSAVVSMVSYKVFGFDLSKIFRWGVAGQYILDEVFQPCTFGVLIILSIYVFLSEKPFLAVLFLALATTFHPAYFLCSIILTLSYMIIIFKMEKNIKKIFSIGFFAFVLVLPILSYVLVSFSPTSLESWNKSQDILYNFRTPHHANPSIWLNGQAYAQILIIIIALWLLRKTRLFLIMLFLFLAATAFTIAQMLSGSKTLALLFPWRSSVFLVPISSSIIIACIVDNIFKKYTHKVIRNQKIISLLSIVLILMLALGGVARMKIRFDRKLKEDSIPMMNFVKTTKSQGETYLVPCLTRTDLEDFRLYTGVPVFVLFKTPPRKDIELVEWYKRVQIMKSFYETTNIDCEVLKGLSMDYGITHVVLRKNHFNHKCNILQELYRDNKYAVYKIDRSKN